MKEMSVVPSFINATSSRGRRAHLEYDIRLGPQIRCARCNRRACYHIGVIGEIGAIAGPAFHRYRKTELNQLFNNFRNGRNAPLARKYFLGNSNGHAHRRLTVKKWARRTPSPRYKLLKETLGDDVNTAHW